MGNLNVEEIMDSLSGEELCKYCRYGIDYDCNGGVRSDGAGNPIYPPCADGLDEDYFDLDAYLADEGVPENCEECRFYRCDGDKCLLHNEDIPEKAYLDGERLNSCHLKELPGYMKGEPKKDYNKMYQAGYNACLDNILNK